MNTFDDDDDGDDVDPLDPRYDRRHTRLNGLTGDEFRAKTGSRLTNGELGLLECPAWAALRPCQTCGWHLSLGGDYDAYDAEDIIVWNISKLPLENIWELTGNVVPLFRYAFVPTSGLH